jgi:hypothetical protein
VPERHRGIDRIRCRSDRRRADCARRDRIDREPEARMHELVTGAAENLRQLHQDFVRAVAEHDAFERHVVMVGKPVPQRHAHRVGIAEHLRDRRTAQRGQHPGAGAPGILVRTKFDQLAGRTRLAQRRQIMPGIIGLQRLQRGRGTIDESAHVDSTATG